ncbi:hypothetical protein C370_05532 [Cryptococcus neoformans A1-35-8]|nr:hypothetical protein C353_05316 [Cryptococcus neoformans var. grubii AD1-83a]OXG47849.1 hypothetical protein C354_06203 [Cryptococcus neoformans var. grubii MW-RSA1955]OXG56145.1 hypothetical protein C352_05233 [Cryptococcus neoformans var. grubii CHC193]OXH05106.1 hypothetical protein C369_05441 [Cryptococcus neoformans var. grubii A5-35-17]OXH06421.1 hypothetical protein C370_05532 [Cryptococcus neoformans var. grubii A1-35-8]
MKPKLVDKSSIKGYNLPSTLQKLICHFRKHRRPESQAIIFCKTKDQPQAVSEIMTRAGQKATWYNSETGDRDLVRKFFGPGHAQGESQIDFICSTSGLGAGVNMPNIDAVYFLGDPWDLIEVIQAGGRGGRLGHLFRVCVFSGSFSKSVSYDPNGLRLVKEWMEHKVCRRLTIGSYMDGTEATCRTLNAAQCDLCAQNVPHKRGHQDTYSAPRHDPPPTSRLIQSSWFHRPDQTHPLFHRLLSAPANEQDHLVASNQMAIWENFFSALKRLIPKLSYTEEEWESRSNPSWCPLCFGCGELRKHDGSGKDKKWRV